MMPFIHRANELFSSHSNAENAQKQSAYLKGLFPFFGLSHPKRREVQALLFKEMPFHDADSLVLTVKDLWQQEKREYHYAAQELLFKYKKLWNDTFLSLFEMMLRHHQWWDTVDFIAANLVGPYLVKHPEKLSYMDEWIEDSNFWIRRAALLYQLKWKQQTDSQKLFSYCEKTMHEKEFFIRKAIGWVLREYSKTSPQAVKEFVMKHQSRLSGLSYREASKYL